MMITSDFLKKMMPLFIIIIIIITVHEFNHNFFFRVNKRLLSFTELSVQLQCNNNVFILSMSQLKL